MKPIFKFSPSIKGAVGKFNFGPHKKDNSIVGFFEIQSQTSWDAAKKVGSCKNGPSAKAMLNQVELCGILNAINENSSWKAYHKVAGGAQCAISLDFIEGKGFTFKLFRDNVNFLIGLTPAEARLLALNIEANIKLDAVQWTNKQSTSAQDEGEYAAEQE